MTPEHWLPVIGYEGFYSVSSHGNVRAEARIVHSANRFGEFQKPIKEKLLHLNDDKHGYKFVVLCRDGITSIRKVSRLVLLTFVGPVVGDKNEAMHIDHNPANNAIDNLEWGTRQENEDQKTNAGRRSRWAKLTDCQVIEIRALRLQGMTLKALGEAFHTHLSNIHLITKGKTWLR